VASGVVRETLDEITNFLGTIEIQVLRAIAKHDAPVSTEIVLKELESTLGLPTSEILNALESLQNRSLLKIQLVPRSSSFLSLSELVKKYTLSSLTALPLPQL
jgi:hypothetical protein